MLLSLSPSGCVLTGIEPDEIDVAQDDETGEDANEGEAEAGDGDGDPGGDGDGDDPTGDGDGDATDTGDGDGDPTGDGDGDGDGDPSTGDGDGDATTTGDGDGDPPTDCDEFGPTSVYAGENPVALLAQVNSFAGSCGGADGSDAIFSYTAITDGEVTFLLQDADFDGVLYLADTVCDPLVELACDPSEIAIDLTVGQVVHIIVDANLATDGAALLVVVEP